MSTAKRLVLSLRGRKSNQQQESIIQENNISYSGATSSQHLLISSSINSANSYSSPVSDNHELDEIAIVSGPSSSSNQQLLLYGSTQTTSTTTATGVAGITGVGTELLSPYGRQSSVSISGHDNQLFVSGIGEDTNGPTRFPSDCCCK
ncbi:uncharacterized protein LOC129610852 isoform X2 [Condylostylus longicornis]|uniref:uncharacterized protein LOC129610852 isoform X2 n=1 Tax=Condylostylus longicornis TaxID=2530218 RepID=UPI00244DD148|nr:uncharacterized protein LOC129610852 isoform X2 [Condylostylus longicornis]